MDPSGPKNTRIDGLNGTLAKSSDKQKMDQKRSRKNDKTNKYQAKNESSEPSTSSRRSGSGKAPTSRGLSPYPHFKRQMMKFGSVPSEALMKKPRQEKSRLLGFPRSQHRPTCAITTPRGNRTRQKCIKRQNMMTKKLKLTKTPRLKRRRCLLHHNKPTGPKKMNNSWQILPIITNKHDYTVVD